jgi:hypothetical protein
LSRGIYIYLFSPFFPKDEYHDAWRFIGKHGVTFYPFAASLKYKRLNAKICYGGGVLPYIEHGNKKLYLPKNLSEREMEFIYRYLLTEQDIDSPHRYVNSYAELEGKIVLDIGAAEGIFALDAIEYAEKVYLFECDDQWIEALQATFEPWKEKVEIVRKYVGDTDTEECVTLDSFMEGKEQDNLHLKMDIEGAEQSALQGAKKLLTNGKRISFSVCTYHRDEDAKAISSFFESLGYTYEFTRGLFCMRKAVCRGRNYNN